MLENSLVTEILIEIGYDPTEKDNLAIKTACKDGLIDTVRVLLSDSRIDPRVDDNLLFKNAIYQYGIMKVLLLAMLEEHSSSR